MALPLHAFEHLYRRHYGYVVSVLRRFGVDAAYVEDVAQEVFIVAYRRSDESVASLRPWLYGIARRTASNHRRTVERLQRKHRTVAEATDVQGPPQRFENILAVDEFLRNLPSRDREVFVLSEIEGMSGSEVASALRLKTSTTYARLRAIRSRFDAHVHPAEPQHLLEQCREDRPQGSWAAILPLLKATPAPTLWGLSSLGLAKAWVFPAVAIGLPGVFGASLGVAVALREPSVPEVAPERAPLHASAPLEKETPLTAGVVEAVHPSLDSAVAVPSSEPSKTHAHRSAPPRPMHDELAREARLLREATLALRNDRPQEALERIAMIGRSTALAEPTAALRIEALCAVGRKDEARDEVTFFEQTYPASPLRSRVRKTCR